MPSDVPKDLTPGISANREANAVGPRSNLRDPTTLAVLGLCAVIVAAWSFRALHDPGTADLGLAYTAGVVAWFTGHPEHLASWTGTPLLAMVMAVVSRIVSIGRATQLISIVNLTLFLGVFAVVLGRLRSCVSLRWWRILALGLAGFAPLMSTVWWKQFNLVALVLGLAGFELLRRSKTGLGAALIGSSVAFKPLIVLLPLVLLSRRETRRAGALALACALALTVVGQAFLAWRAHNAAVLNPLSALDNFATKADSISSGYACYTDNFAPTATLCRLMGTHYWTVERVAAESLVALLALWVIVSMRGRSTLSWDAFAFTCALSVMLGPIAWSHYGLMLAPLFIVLVVRFQHAATPPAMWRGLCLAFVLVSLTWQPYGTIVRFVWLLLAHGEISDSVRPAPGVRPVELLGQFAQYVLLLTAIVWYSRHGPPVDRIRGRPDRERSAVGP